MEPVPEPKRPASAYCGTPDGPKLFYYWLPVVDGLTTVYQPFAAPLAVWRCLEMPWYQSGADHLNPMYSTPERALRALEEACHMALCTQVPKPPWRKTA